MKQTFKLQNGEISFGKEGISILDNAKKQYLLRIFSSTIWVFYGIISFLRYMKTGNQFLLWTGSFLGITHLFILSNMLIRSTQNNIKTHEIKSLKIKQRFSTKFLDIKLKNNRLRRVMLDENIKELQEFIGDNF
ncbi:hypothetical protein EMN47_17710 [Prolixibacteraceae bacterium JC049]|nr:hypothetical protein [Prolixibacteraceae bacterium JC049]